MHKDKEFGLPEPEYWAPEPLTEAAEAIGKDFKTVWFWVSEPNLEGKLKLMLLPLKQETLL